MEIKGLNEAISKLDNLARNAERLNGANEVPLVELMPDRFIKAYTDYDSLNDLMGASAVEDAAEIGGEKWNEFIVTHTRFSSWDEMVKKAGAQWMTKQLGF